MNARSSRCMLSRAVDAAELYDRVRADFDRLDRDGASRGEWLQYSNRLLDTLMKCQAIVIEHQKRLLACARGESDAEDYKQARQASRDGLHILDCISALHERTRAKLLSLAR